MNSGSGLAVLDGLTGVKPVLFNKGVDGLRVEWARGVCVGW